MPMPFRQDAQSALVTFPNDRHGRSETARLNESGARRVFTNTPLMHITAGDCCLLLTSHGG